MISASRSSLSGTMFRCASFLKVKGSIASAVPSQLLPTHRTGRVGPAACAVAAVHSSAAQSRASASTRRFMSAILDFDRSAGRRLACGRVTRVEAFSDAVLAIAITVLVVELPFDKGGEGELGHALGDHWATFAAYGLSFVGIGILWLHHHAIFSAVGHVDRRLVLLNLILLFCAAFLPYPTSLLGDYLSDGGSNARVAMLLYSGTWTVVSAGAGLMCWHVLRTPRLLSP